MKKRLFITSIIATPVLAGIIVLGMNKPVDSPEQVDNVVESVVITHSEAPDEALEQKVVDEPVDHTGVVAEPVLTPEQKQEMRLAEIKKLQDERINREALTYEQLVDKYGLENHKRLNYIKYMFDNRYEYYLSTNEELFVNIVRSIDGYGSEVVKRYSVQYELYQQGLRDIASKYN